jgi:hypothetical protein
LADAEVVRSVDFQSMSLSLSLSVLLLLFIMLADAEVVRKCERGLAIFVCCFSDQLSLHLIVDVKM